VGTHKVRAVSDALSLIAAGLQVDARTTRLAGQESAVTAAAALKDLSNCDLLIDATANPEVFLLLAALAKRQGTPLCWGEIFASGYGGMIARARPGRDPNPMAVRPFPTRPSRTRQTTTGLKNNRWSHTTATSVPSRPH